MSEETAEKNKNPLSDLASILKGARNGVFRTLGISDEEMIPCGARGRNSNDYQRGRMPERDRS